MSRYAEVIRRLERAAGEQLRPLVAAGGLPVFWLERRPPGIPRRHVALTAGVHGDEPAGVEAVLRFLESPAPRWARGIRFLVLPCLNPFGYEHQTRHNHDRLDLNRQYRHDRVPEVAAHKRLLAGQWFDLHLSLHEDVDAPGFYIYELSRTPRHIAARIVRAVSRHLPIDPRPLIEGRRACQGVIRRHERPARRRHWPEAFHLFAHHTDHSLTTETPASFPFEKRVTAQLAALRTACECLRSR